MRVAVTHRKHRGSGRQGEEGEGSNLLHGWWMEGVFSIEMVMMICFVLFCWRSVKYHDTLPRESIPSSHEQMYSIRSIRINSTPPSVPVLGPPVPPPPHHSIEQHPDHI